MGKVIGLTGSIASGKSTVSNKLKSMGYQVIDCDQINHEILKKDKQLIEALWQLGLMK